MKWIVAIVCAALVLPLGPSPVEADSISEVEGARAMERAYRPLSRQDIEKLRRYGGNDDYAPRYGYGYDGYGGDYYDGPSVGIYVGPAHGPRGYYYPY